MERTRIASAIVAALALQGGAHAVEYKLSGSVNRMIRFADNGAGSDVAHVDNEAERTRFRFETEVDPDDGQRYRAGIYVETSVSSNNASTVALKAGDGGDVAFDIRHSALWFSSPWGKVTMGHTSDAHDNIAYEELSESWLVNEWSSNFDLGGALTFGGTTTTLASAFSSFDGARRDVLRYDTPDMHGVTLKASVANDSVWSVGAVAARDFDGGDKLKAAFGYSDLGGSSGPAGPSNQWTGIFSYRLQQGPSITVGYAGADGGAGAPDPDMLYLKLGHHWGREAVSVHWGESRDLSARGESNTMWGVGWVHTLRKNVDLYAAYNRFDLDRAGAQDVDVFVIGARIKFTEQLP